MFKRWHSWISATLAMAALLPLQALSQNSPKVKFATSQGEFTVELYPDKAPKTVENFLQYVKDKHYDGTIFHRVISNFMVQGGGFDTKFAEKKTRAPIAHEGREALSRGGPKNTTGTLAMARTIDPQSATAQFFINVQDNAFLDPILIPPGDPVSRFEHQGRVYKDTPRDQLVNDPKFFGYTVFGKVIIGMDVVQKIRNIPTGAGGPFSENLPLTTVVISSATLVK